MRVDGEFKHFGKVNGQFGDFGGAVVGVGLIHSPADSSLDMDQSIYAFASCGGEFLGKNLIKN